MQYIKILVGLFFLAAVRVAATPPACFLSCVSEVSRTCPHKLDDIPCVCAKKNVLIGCLVDICPYGVFDAARDHFLGTCLEHSKPASTEPSTPALGPMYTAKPLQKDGGRGGQDVDKNRQPHIDQQHRDAHNIPNEAGEKEPESSDRTDKDSGYPYDKIEAKDGNRWEEERSEDENGIVYIIRRLKNAPTQHKQPSVEVPVERQTMKHANDVLRKEEPPKVWETYIPSIPNLRLIRKPKDPKAVAQVGTYN
ncbi:Piso0_000552 [Millerozyma farinosa CBS 7064]|uniref:Piso0_000552 protein n=1 Tax=Pichia sorbitophila (strain ATCC MYA-4447 / BCRC 22081 / CBS 7064 / NBRC 10061 / NRRL Y-12695) TaxID=559304 RepID=G8YVR2_PICSO|nr:Piso0_000552 [Millerozyma farinosa CBS 7064]CCE73506.1 Piso0_000552 [Millerozyma farinosa CBS 7064]